MHFGTSPRHEDISDNDDQDVDEVVEKIYVYRPKSLYDVQLDLFWIEEKRKMLYGKSGLFAENPHFAKFINATVLL